jgi:hypothetical protein
MPNDISAAAAWPWAMIRVGLESSSTVLPEPSVKLQGPFEDPSLDESDPQAAKAAAASSAAARGTRERRNLGKASTHPFVSPDSGSRN